ncbi:MAG: glycosyltransferase family 2 protein [Parachlamydiales bacterium]|jgi:hypothetical protein
MKICLVILNYNGLSDTLECLDSVFKMDHPAFEVIVIDNGSKIKPKKTILERFGQTQVIENPENLGFAEGCNLGIRQALKNGAEAILLLNNDTIVDSRLLKELELAVQETPQGGILGAKILCYHQRETIDNVGGFFSFQDGHFFYYGSGSHKDSPSYCRMRKVDYICGGAFLIKKEVIEKIGFLEKNFFLLWEEADFCLRAEKSGFESWNVPKALVWHKISASFSGGKIHSDYFWWRGRLLFLKRNLSPLELKSLYRRTIWKEIFKLYKRKTLKTLELYLLKYLARAPIEEIKIRKALRYRASWQGIKDYFFRRFNSGPAWIGQYEKTPFYRRFAKKGQN